LQGVVTCLAGCSGHSDILLVVNIGQNASVACSSDCGLGSFIANHSGFNKERSAVNIVVQSMKFDCICFLL
jgi:hypothetical protein